MTTSTTNDNDVLVHDATPGMVVVLDTPRTDWRRVTIVSVAPSLLAGVPYGFWVTYENEAGVRAARAFRRGDSTLAEAIA